MTGRGKWPITFLGLNLQQEFAQGLKGLLKLPHGQPASVWGLLTQEVWIHCGSWVVRRTLDFLGEVLANPHLISLLLGKGSCQRDALEKTLPAPCQHPKGGKPCISPLASLSTQRARGTHIRPKRKTLLCFSEQASWARHQGEPRRRNIRSSNHLFLWRGASEAFLSATRSLLLVPWENNSVSQQQRKIRRKRNAAGNKRLWKLWHRQGMRKLSQLLRQNELAVMGKDRDKRYCKTS